MQARAKPSVTFACFFFAFLVMGCSGSMTDRADMEGAEQKFLETQKSEMILLMPLALAFSDARVRELASAAASAQLEVLQSLASTGVNVNATGRSGVTPLFWALRNNSFPGFATLLELGADPNAVFGFGSTVVHWSVRTKGSKFLNTVLLKGGDPNAGTNRGIDPPMFWAITLENDEVLGQVELLIEHGANVNYEDEYGNTPALLAAGFGRFDVVCALLRQGADPFAENSFGISLRNRIEEIGAGIRANDPQLEFFAQAMELTKNTITD